MNPDNLDGDDGPDRLLDAMLRIGPYRLSLAQLRAYPADDTGRLRAALSRPPAPMVLIGRTTCGGWGHRRTGQTVAVDHAGVNVNKLTGGAVDVLSGNTVFNGVSVTRHARGLSGRDGRCAWMEMMGWSRWREAVSMTDISPASPPSLLAPPRGAVARQRTLGSMMIPRRYARPRAAGAQR
ncbi:MULTISPECIES: hypothetical protein [unclassified Micromonospora]|uniref:hypothetical protein n=1 Tax=unclassified Micromonospora TaxID=2617518 RepID=UPI003A8C6249